MHPYARLGARAFWATAVAQRDMLAIDELWKPKVLIDRSTKVATHGSCFAQHFGRALSARGYNWYVTEPAPPGLSIESARKFNYGVFSSRTANIYTTTLLKQWVSWALGDSTPPVEVWSKSGRIYDPFRPRIEPDGFLSEAEMFASRQATLAAFRKTLRTADVFVFTLGLTESWFNREGGYEYPMCPGTAAGEFDASRHEFVNQDYPTIQAALIETINRIKLVNPGIRFLLTVSPVPLTATNSGNHVLVATMESKSILRAVAGAVARQFEDVDYFPSYEIISAPTFRGAFFEPNQRDVMAAGVDHVMSQFFGGVDETYAANMVHAPVAAKESAPAGGVESSSDDDVICEEVLLEAFATRA